MAHVVGSRHGRQPGATTRRMTTSENSKAERQGSALKRLWPVAVLLVAVAGLFVFGPDNPAIFETLAVLGKPRSVSRIAEAVDSLRNA